jgi:hypothetical protein
MRWQIGWQGLVLAIVRFEPDCFWVCTAPALTLLTAVLASGCSGSGCRVDIDGRHRLLYESRAGREVRTPRSLTRKTHAMEGYLLE